MNPNSSKNFVLVAGGIFLLVGAVMMARSVQMPWYKNVKMEVTNQPNARTITVSGDGKVTVKPDIAWIDLSVVTTGVNVKEVLRNGNTQMTQVINAVKKAGVDAKDIQSSSYNLYPEMTWDQKQVSSIKGYSLNQSVTVKVRNLDSVEDVLSAALNSGANQVGQLRFDIDDVQKVQDEARKMAFDKAKSKAADMAQAAGVSLGRVVTFSESGVGTPIVYPMMAMDRAMGSAAAVPAPSIEPGSQDVSMNVSVTYEIE